VSVAVREPHRRPYLDALTTVLGRAKVSNVDTLPAAAELVAQVVARDGIVYVFGSGHSQLAALDVNVRAGSIAPLQVIFDPTWGASEFVEGYAATLLTRVAFTPADCLFVISNSGTTSAPVEVAMAARAAGTPVVAVTAVEIARAARPRHSSGLKLLDLADTIIDNGSVATDVAVRVGSVGVGATSTVVAAALLHEVFVEAVIALSASEVELPVYLANSENGGQDHNARLRERYQGRLHAVP
jgi:uncharacterized phosphosugar-binding protein